MRNIISFSKKYWHLFLILVLGFIGGVSGTYFINSMNIFPKTSSIDSIKPKTISTSYKNITSVTDAVSKIENAVVSVITYTDRTSSNSVFNSEEFEPDEEYSNIYSEGSGVIYRKEGKTAYLVTNNHVVAGGDKIQILLTDGDKVEGKLIGADTYSDIAVVKINSEKVTDVAEFGDSSTLNIGEIAIAIGSPLGSHYANSVTQGIVSSLSRTIELTTEDGQAISTNAIQTDAAINPGNSGGPLINIQGQIIGITSSKISRSGNKTSSVAVEGIGFAIPSNDVLEIIKQLEKNGTVTRPALGIQMTSLTNLSTTDLNRLNLLKNVTHGIVVRSVQSGMPADGKLEKYDVITKVDDKEVSTSSDLQSALYKHVIGDTLKVTFYRDGREKTTEIKLDKSSKDLKLD